MRSGEARHANTSQAVVSLLAAGYASPLGQRIIAEIMRIHEPLGIPNEEMWYALATLARQPIEWIDRFGWRRLASSEKDALYWFWREVGLRLQLTGAPADPQAMEEFLHDYERSHFALAPENQQMVAVAQQEWLTRFPHGLRWAARAIFLSVLDNRIRESLGLPHPSPWIQQAVASFFLMRRHALAVSPALRRSWWAGGWAVDRVKTSQSSRFLQSIA
jgi:hypothetical protein